MIKIHVAGTETEVVEAVARLGGLFFVPETHAFTRAAAAAGSAPHRRMICVRGGDRSRLPHALMDWVRP